MILLSIYPALSLSYDTYQVILFSWIALAIIVFFVLLKITAPYGRHTTTKWGPAISNRIGWILMEAPVLLVLLWFVLPAKDQLSIASWLMLGMFCFHYVNRIFIFPFRIRTRGKTMPLLIVLSAIFFNLMNGFSLGYYFGNFANYTNQWLTDPRFVMGSLLFILGMAINWKADSDLISLRKPGETHYVIPNSNLFRWISCPNLFGELIEWLGFAILCWNLPACTFLIWTAANLIPRAMSHHQWYKQKFVDYPQDRKAIIPFLL